MWWQTMTSFQQTMFIIACAATFILVLQIVLMLIGNDGDDITGAAEVSDVSDVTDVSDPFDLDASVDGGVSDEAPIDHTSSFGLRLLSFRSIIAFLSIGGWLGYTCGYYLDWYWAFLIALAGGIAAACGMAGAMIGIEKMQGDGALDPSNAVGVVGTVYLTVPPARSGVGKVNILIQERYAEYEAMTDGDEPLPTGSEIRVFSHLGTTLLVEKYKKPSITVETTD